MPLPLSLPALPDFLPALLLGLSLFVYWIQSTRSRETSCSPPLAWIPIVIAAVGLGWYLNQLSPTAVAALLLMNALGWGARYGAQHRRSWLLRLCWVGMAILALALAAHQVPGFDNVLLLQNVQISSDAPSRSLYANFDKGCAGLLLWFWTQWRPASDTPALPLTPTPARSSPQPSTRPCTWPRTLRTCLEAYVLTSLATFGLAVITGFVKLDPKLPAYALTFLLTNLFLSCIAEEAFFRGLIQAPLMRRMKGRDGGGGPGASWIPLGVTTLLFAAVHAPGGGLYVALTAVAGLGYGWVYQRTRRVDCAIAVHFMVNATHFLGFTYPRLS